MENSSNSSIKHLDKLSISAVDYTMFALVLLISAGIGVFFGFYKKQKTTADYLLGGKNMGVIPVAVSLAASYTSAITLLGMPAEIYTYGSPYTASCLGPPIVSLVISRIYLPVFYDSQLSSSYEYLSLRFDRRVRLMISSITLFDIILFVPMVIYAPSIMFNLVTGIELKYVIGIVSIVCIFYTAVGGLKSVVWTDTIQYAIMNGSILAIFILGVINEGGFKEIWRKGKEGGRVDMWSFEFNMFTRATFFSTTIGLCMNWVNSMGVHQTSVQRFLAVPSLSDAKKVLYIYVVAVVTVKSFCLFSGLIIYARYMGCDPLASGIIEKADQILPYYVMDTARNIPGLPGLFIAGIFSAALSTMSTNLNAAGGIIYTDFLVSILPKTTTEETASKIMKSTVVILGILTTILAMYVEKLGNILPITIQFTGVTTGAMLGTFTMGMLSRRANATGALCGSIFSMAVMCWIMFYNLAANIRYPFKDLSVDQCEVSVNTTTTAFTPEPEESHNDVFFLFRISFMWYSLIGTVSTVVVGLLTSYLTDPPTEQQSKLEYFSPVIRTKEEDEIVRKTVMEMNEYAKVPSEK